MNELLRYVEPERRVALAHLDTGTGRPVVVIHGANGNHRDWSFGPLSIFSDRARAIAVDRPGLGNSDPARADSGNPFVQAKLIRDAMALVRAEKPIVVGQSFGGAVALAWALDAPETVSGLMLVSSPSHVWPTPVEKAYWIAAQPVIGHVTSYFAELYMTEEKIDEAVTRIFAPDPVPPGYVDFLRPELSLRPRCVRQTGKEISGLKDVIREMEPRYQERLTMPVEIIHGTEDSVVNIGVHSDRLAERLPHAIYQRLEGRGHMPHHSEPDALARAFERLLEA